MYSHGVLRRLPRHGGLRLRTSAAGDGDQSDPASLGEEAPESVETAGFGSESRNPHATASSGSWMISQTLADAEVTPPEMAQFVAP